MRGLTAGAPVEFHGIPIGEVADVRAQIDLQTFQFLGAGDNHLDPQRLGVRFWERRRRESRDGAQKADRFLGGPWGPSATANGKFADRSGVRGARLFPRLAAGHAGLVAAARAVADNSGQLEQTEASINNIIKKLNKMPLQQIGDNLQKALGDLDLTLVSARGTLTTAQGTLGNTTDLTVANSYPVQQLDSTLQEVSEAARSVRVLADYLERHPEALIRGKKGGRSDVSSYSASDLNRNGRRSSAWMQHHAGRGSMRLTPPPPRTVRPLRHTAVAVGPVTVPASVDQPELPWFRSLRTASRSDEFNRWARAAER